jgi:hypothetical protein
MGFAPTAGATRKPSAEWKMCPFPSLNRDLKVARRKPKGSLSCAARSRSRTEAVAEQIPRRKSSASECRSGESTDT